MGERDKDKERASFRLKEKAVKFDMCTPDRPHRLKTARRRACQTQLPSELPDRRQGRSSRQPAAAHRERGLHRARAAHQRRSQTDERGTDPKRQHAAAHNCTRRARAPTSPTL